MGFWTYKVFTKVDGIGCELSRKGDPVLGGSHTQLSKQYCSQRKLDFSVL